ncbi:DUF2997 domain-containing protein [Nocardia crassostreae]|uniref:DUF2997 domain-containing protein n=1 Tax=Nocardia crassostreae TaxID=53428 RepID=UPI0008377CA2|nr:DUF2997 domain-containing protein [Nocardia crassostreae]
MSEPVRITVTIAADGQVSAQTHDTVGAGRLPYIQILENMLEATTLDSEYTGDWWKTAAAPVVSHLDPAVDPARVDDRL